MNKLVMCAQHHIIDLPEEQSFFPFSKTILDRIMTSAVWDDRQHAEEIGLIKLIPCCVVMCHHIVFSYTRSELSDQKSLIGAGSCLIGGHIQDEDLHWWKNKMAQGGPDVMWSAMARELKEEIDLELLMQEQVEPLGFVRDFNGDPGKHYLGIVFLFPLPEPIKFGGEMDILVNRQWTPIHALQEQGTLEPWSQIIIDELCSQARFTDYAQEIGVRSSYGRPLF